MCENSYQCSRNQCIKKLTLKILLQHFKVFNSMKFFHHISFLSFIFSYCRKNSLFFFFSTCSSFSRNVHVSERNRHLNGVIRNLRYLFISLNIRFADIDLLSFPSSTVVRKNKYPQILTERSISVSCDLISLMLTRRGKSEFRSLRSEMGRIGRIAKPLLSIGFEFDSIWTTGVVLVNSARRLCIPSHSSPSPLSPYASWLPSSARSDIWFGADNRYRLLSPVFTKNESCLQSSESSNFSTNFRALK